MIIEQLNYRMTDRHYARTIATDDLGRAFAAYGHFQPGDMTNYEFTMVVDPCGDHYHVAGRLLKGLVVLDIRRARAAVAREEDSNGGALLHDYVKQITSEQGCNPWTVRGAMMWLVEVLDAAKDFAEKVVADVERADQVLALAKRLRADMGAGVSERDVLRATDTIMRRMYPSLGATGIYDAYRVAAKAVGAEPVAESADERRGRRS